MEWPVLKKKRLLTGNDDGETVVRVVPATVGLICFTLSGCAQAFRGDTDQVYVDNSFALTDAQGIDAASKYCAVYGKTALYRGQYSPGTAVFACIIPNSAGPPVAANATSALPVDINLLHHSADLGDTDAMVKLGVLYSGIGSSLGHLPPDYGQSMLWLHRAADEGNSNAMAFIGASYLRGEDGLKADQGEAVRWLRKASELGNPAAMYSLGMVLGHGPSTPADKAEAMKWFIKSAQLGSVDAMTMAGIQYVSGVNGQGPNYVEANYWFRSAADKGDAAAMFMLADLYRYGLGVPTDYAEAMRWSLRAAHVGNVDAMKLIGEMYEKGLGVPEDKVESRRWFQMAAKQGGN
jgi:TPR repeat protein